MKSTDRLHKALLTAHNKLESAEGELLSALQPFADFEIGLTYQPSDGWMVTDGVANNCSLDVVLEEFKGTGRVTHEHFLDNTI